MDPLSGALIVSLASVAASTAKTVVTRLWQKYILPRTSKRFTITTNSGKRVTIDEITGLSDEKIKEIVAAVEDKSQGGPAKQS